MASGPLLRLDPAAICAICMSTATSASGLVPHGCSSVAAGHTVSAMSVSSDGMGVLAPAVSTAPPPDRAGYSRGRGGGAQRGGGARNTSAPAGLARESSLDGVITTYRRGPRALWQPLCRPRGGPSAFWLSTADSWGCASSAPTPQRSLRPKSSAPTCWAGATPDMPPEAVSPLTANSCMPRSVQVKP